MNCLVISDTFPNRSEPSRGPYNRRQIEGLARLCDVRVINPISWVRLAKQPRLLRVIKAGSDGLLDNVRIMHPLHVHVPLLGRPMLGRSLGRCVRRHVQGFAPAAGFDVVYSTWAFPHGHAAMQIARRYGLPYVAKLRGSDINALPARGRRRRLAARAVAEADAVVAVSRELADKALAMGAATGRVHLLHNGVDLERFQPANRDAARGRLPVAAGRKVVLFVGSLLPVKAPGVLLEAFARAGARTEASLVFVGTGALRGRLLARARRLDIAGRVLCVGGVPHEDVSLWLNAADVLCLPSLSEGCPNVVLEALACGTPVVASRVGAVPDLLDETCGITVEPGSAGELADAIDAALDRKWDRAAVRRRVEGMSWEANARRLHQVLTAAVRHGPMTPSTVLLRNESG